MTIISFSKFVIYLPEKWKQTFSNLQIAQDLSPHILLNYYHFIYSHK